MDVKQIKKLTKDKIEADTFTKIVRQNIKRNKIERQNAREAFKEAFEVLLEAQDTNTKTQNAMLKELKKLNHRMQQNLNDGQEVVDEEEPSENEEEPSENEAKPHMRIPEVLYRGLSGLLSRVESSIITKALVGTVGIASAIAASSYLGDQPGNQTGNERYATSADTFEPNLNMLKDNLYKLSTETALAIYDQTKLQPDAGGVSGLSDLIYRGIIGSAGTNAAIAAYRLIADKLSPDSILQSINSIKRGLMKPFQKKKNYQHLLRFHLMLNLFKRGNRTSTPSLFSSDVFPPAAPPLQQDYPLSVFQPTTYSLPRVAHSLFSSDVFPTVSQPVPQPVFQKLDKPVFPKPPNNDFPIVDKLFSTDLKKLDYLYSRLSNMKYNIENKINVLRIKQNKTQEDENLLREYLRQEKEINDYFQYFFEHHEMRSFLEASLPNLKDPPSRLDDLDINKLDYLSGILFFNRRHLKDKIKRENKNVEYKQQLNELDKYIYNFMNYYLKKRQTGQGLIFFKKPKELLKRLELLDASLRSGNNGVLIEYIHILHHLRDIGVISNDQLNKLLKKYINI